MNYDQPRQLQTGDNAGKWHYTTANRRTGVHPIGYCANHAPHDTEDEARGCYQDYLFDNVSFIDDRPDASQAFRCRVCNAWTSGFARGLGGWQIEHLCVEHRNRQTVAELWGALAGDSMHS